MIGLARELMAEAPAVGHERESIDLNTAAAALQGTLSELGRMIQVGVIPGPAMQWRDGLVTLFKKLAA